MARTDRQLIAHLLRRAGFGGNSADIDAYTALGFEGAVDRLINYQSVGDSAIEQAVTDLRSKSPASTNQMHPEYGNPAVEIATWIMRMLNTKRPLQEKMTLFWHGHFTSSIVDVKVASLMTGQNNLFRQNALSADFKAFTKQVARDPAMLIYLNNDENRKGAPNENWARELMELFVLGIGNYTEDDVKQAARAFTGWTVERGTGKFVFRAQLHDSDSKTFMGVTGNLNGDDIIDTIFAQPPHAKFMARKLFRFFVYDDPDDAAVARFADIYAKSGLSIKELVRQLLLSPEFRSDKAFYALIKSPAEYCVGALKALSANITDLPTLNTVTAAMTAQGQQLWNPPNVGGWPGMRNWINSTTFFNRANFAQKVVSIDSNMTTDPGEIAKADGKSTPSDVVDHFLDILLESDTSPDYRASLLTYAGSFRDAKDADGKIRGIARLIMSSPDYQMN